jgi:hypothetical protein
MERLYRVYSGVPQCGEGSVEQRIHIEICGLSHRDQGCMSRHFRGRLGDPSSRPKTRELRCRIPGPRMGAGQFFLIDFIIGISFNSCQCSLTFLPTLQSFKRSATRHREQPQLALALPAPRKNSDTGRGLVAASHSASVTTHSLPNIKSTAQQPLTCGPGERKCPSNSASVQPASSRASARIGSCSNTRAV